MNVFRLPVSWQFLVNQNLGGKLDYHAIGLYNDLVQGCLNTGSYCIIDIHNYARWNGGSNIIGQGGPSNEQFASLWHQLAKKYKRHRKIIFGLMNEPHSFDVDLWADTIQHTVHEIRKAGAISQKIFLPGTNYTSAVGFATFSAPALSKVKDYDGSNHRLIYEIHKYYDDSKEGSLNECTTDHIEDAYHPLADYLRKHKRRAFLGETGGGPTTASCSKYLCSALEFINYNSDVYLGFTGWSAGAFFPHYALGLTPKGSAKKGWKDQPLLKKCFAKDFSKSATGVRHRDIDLEEEPQGITLAEEEDF